MLVILRLCIAGYRVGQGMDKLLNFVDAEDEVYTSDGVPMYQVGEKIESKLPRQDESYTFSCWGGDNITTASASAKGFSDSLATQAWDPGRHVAVLSRPSFYIRPMPACNPSPATVTLNSRPPSLSLPFPPNNN